MDLLALRAAFLLTTNQAEWFGLKVDRNAAWIALLSKSTFKPAEPSGFNNPYEISPNQTTIAWKDAASHDRNCVESHWFVMPTAYLSAKPVHL